MTGTPRTRAAFFVALSAVCFGAMAVLARHAYDSGVDPLALLCLRFGLAAVLLGAVLRFRRQRWPGGRSLITLLIMGGIGYVAQSLSFFSALQFAPAALVALLLYLHPVMIASASRALYGEPLGPTRLACILLALFGTTFVLGLSQDAHLQGYVLGLMAAIIYAAYLMTGQRVLHTVAPLVAASVVITSAAVVFAALALLAEPQWPATGSAWAAAGAIAIVSTVMAMLLLFSGMRVLGATDAATISTLEPVATAILAWVFLSEVLGPVQWIGVMLVVGSVIGLVRLPSPARVAESQPRK